MQFKPSAFQQKAYFRKFSFFSILYLKYITYFYLDEEFIVSYFLVSILLKERLRLVTQISLTLIKVLEALLVALLDMKLKKVKLNNRDKSSLKSGEISRIRFIDASKKYGNMEF